MSVITNPSPSALPPSLQTIPTEIRLKIFEPCLVYEGCGKKPSLIVALRGDPKMYEEAIELFYSKATFHSLLPGPMTKKALARIQNLEIHPSIFETWAGTDIEMASPPPAIFTGLRSISVNLTSYVETWEQESRLWYKEPCEYSMEIERCIKDTAWELIFRALEKYCAENPELRKVSLRVPEQFQLDTLETIEDWNMMFEMIGGVIEEANVTFGMAAKLENVSVLAEMKGFEGLKFLRILGSTWFWEAAKGEVLYKPTDSEGRSEGEKVTVVVKY